jgi:hypothetical protein
MEQEHHERDADPPTERSIDAERDLSRVPAREPGRARGRDLQRDLGPGVVGPHDECRSVGELSRASVVDGPQLHDRGVEPVGEGRNALHLVTRHRHDDVVGLEKLAAGLDPEPAVLPRDTVHSRTGPDRELEPRGVGLEVVGDLVLRGVGATGSRERHAGEAVGPCRREEAQRVPSAPPRVARPIARVEDQERPAEAPQVVADREPGLAAPDHDRLDPFVSVPTRQGGLRIRT